MQNLESGPSVFIIVYHKVPAFAQLTAFFELKGHLLYVFEHNVPALLIGIGTLLVFGLKVLL